jgi:N utilization substance protein B
MKTSEDPRHVKRIRRMELLFAYAFHPDAADGDIADILSRKEEIDRIIQKAAPEWPIDKISRMDLSILRLAVYELLAETDTPYKVVIDEAVELAKTYGNDSSPKFVNGALGTVMKDLRPAEGGTS